MGQLEAVQTDGEHEPPAPPSALGPRGRARWGQIAAEFDFDMATDLDLLEQYCHALDVLGLLDVAIADQPLMQHSPSAGMIVNRAITEKRAHVQLLQRLASQLNLSVEDESAQMTSTQAARKAARARWDRNGR